MKFKLQHVHYMPKLLESGVLYVSEEFDIAIHLCACGCGSKVKTSLGPTEWLVRETKDGPSLYPSVGNWQQPCQSHYWIDGGLVLWVEAWTSDQIAAGRRHENKRRAEYYTAFDRKRRSLLTRFWNWLKRLHNQE